MLPATDDPPPAQPPPSAQQTWPADVARSDRTACTYVCMRNGVAVSSDQVEVVLNKQLAAIRACALHTSEFHSVPNEVTFGPDGRLRFAVGAYGLKQEMLECMSRIPTPGYFRGPANTRWKCTDYCK
jgi:hypothetical protein